MAKNKKKKAKNKKSDYEVGYGKPPKQYQWKKGCKSPNPKGRPKKAKTLKEAMQICYSKEITIKNDNGDVEKMTCLEALASRTIADAIANDGPTRRLLYRQDLMNLTFKEQEYEYSPDEQKIIDVENTYGKLLYQWAEVEPEQREMFARMYSNALIDIINKRTRGH